jgi:hypothetical protein
MVELEPLHEQRRADGASMRKPSSMAGAGSSCRDHVGQLGERLAGAMTERLTKLEDTLASIEPPVVPVSENSFQPRERIRRRRCVAAKALSRSAWSRFFVMRETPRPALMESTAVFSAVPTAVIRSETKSTSDSTTSAPFASTSFTPSRRRSGSSKRSTIGHLPPIRFARSLHSPGHCRMPTTVSVVGEAFTLRQAAAHASGGSMPASGCTQLTGASSAITSWPVSSSCFAPRRAMRRGLRSAPHAASATDPSARRREH